MTRNTNRPSVPQRQRQRELSSFHFRSVLLFLLLLILWSSTSTSPSTSITVAALSSSNNNNDNNQKEDAAQHDRSSDEQEPIDWLGPQSVVLITGAAGFLGSELALALHRTYSPKNIILIDRMGSGPQESMSMSLFEFQRQRTFHVLQTLGASGQFYRADVRPMIPDYYDLGETPVLDHIFRNHPDITHVVHLADPHPHSALTAVYREKEVPKAGMMESLLEQLTKMKREGNIRVPHFTYASSSEVYPANTTTSTSTTTITNMQLEEQMTLSTPSSLRGASKLMDEVMAKLYHDMHDIYSVGLRFFSVYGPWSAPGSTLFEMAERAVTGNPTLFSQATDSSDGDDNDHDQANDNGHANDNDHEHEHDKDIRDYVYIDDAVDAIMAAMQFRPLGDGNNNDNNNDKVPPVVINVASGQGTSLEKIAKIMQEYFPLIRTNKSKKETKSSSSTSSSKDRPSVSVGSTKRAQELLGFQPRVSLRDGIVELLAWHYDRAFPYGGQSSSSQGKTTDFIASQGIVSCSPHDKECLRAAPVFPCASECSHEGKCTTSFYDEIVGWTQALTDKCDTVLYTVALEDSLTSLPSALFRVNPSSQSFLDGNCNLAFVSQSSHLVQTVQRASRVNLWGSERLLKHGEWILVPVWVSTADEDDLDILKLLPKLSPGLFFGTHTKRAIYTDPNILLDSIPRLLREASVQPFMEGVQGATALLIGKGKPKSYFTQDDDGPSKQVLPRQATRVQNAAYRMIRIAVSDELLNEFMELLDSRWMVHTLQSDDSRLFRCDVYGEVVQWQVDTDRAALEFILGLHDMWTRVMAKQAGNDPWWIGDGVVTVPEGKDGKRRRLQEDSEEKEEGSEENKEEDEEKGGELNEDEESDSDEKVVAAADGKVEANSNTDDDASKKTEELESDEGNVGGFGRQAEGVAQQEVNIDAEKRRGESSEARDDDQVEKNNGNTNTKTPAPVIERDLSAYDTWMGVLSSSSTKYFVRIVPSHEVGVVSLDEYKVDQKDL
jgi:UDP-glucuronate 4-epimerase